MKDDRLSVPSITKTFREASSAETTAKTELDGSLMLTHSAGLSFIYISPLSQLIKRVMMRIVVEKECFQELPV